MLTDTSTRTQHAVCIDRSKTASISRDPVQKDLSSCDLVQMLYKLRALKYVNFN
jgi:hypothetical protein